LLGSLDIFLVSLALALLSLATPINAQTGTPRGGWVRLGSVGNGTEAGLSQAASGARILAIAEDWLVGRTIVLGPGTGQPDMVWRRSVDGGATWSEVALPAGVIQVRLLPPFAGQRLGFAVTASGLQRSTDNAATWQVVASSTTPGVLLVSETFGSDGAALFLADGVARLSGDGGATWKELSSPIEDGAQPFSSVQFSPDFVHDQTLFAVVAGQPFVATVDADGSTAWRSISPGDDLPVEALSISPGFAVDRTLLATMATSDAPAEDELTPEDLDPESATGAVPPAALVSTDGGANWVPAQGLEREGLPYHWHALVQLSPTFDQDQTAFAFAYAPWGHPAASAYRGLPLIRRALFRSDDRGLSWHSIFNRDTLAQTDGGERLVLSPDFARDHFSLLWSVERDIIGRGQTCHVSSTVDSGETWTVARQGGTSYLSGDLGCADMTVGGPPGNLAAVMGTYSGTWEVLTTMPPAGAGLPTDGTGTPESPAPRNSGVKLVATIATPRSSAGPGRGSTLFAVRADGSVWVLPANPN
jgi:hypothetical protein